MCPTHRGSKAELTDSYHVILPDLQGHGENARDLERDYSIRGHVNILDQFLNALTLKRFALGGNSMGGHVSAAYTLAQPDKVSELLLINAPGLKLDEDVVYGGFGEKLESRDDFFAFMVRVVVNRPPLPGPNKWRSLLKLVRRSEHSSINQVRPVSTKWLIDNRIAMPISSARIFV